MTQNALVVVPSNLELPAHLRTAEAAAAIAAANAAAAGGIRAGGFPRLSKDGSKFHIIDGDSDVVLMNPPAGPGQPATPMMLIRVAIVAGNPALSRLYYKDKKVEGTNVAPTCSSSDGVRPDAHVSNPQAAFCKQCQWSVWGSKISEYSGKKITACAEQKQVAFFPADPNGIVDTSKAYGYTFTVSELAEWGAYVNALDSKGASVQAVITNLMFDTSVSHPKILASFGGFLAPEQWQTVLAREHDADVKAIVAPVSRGAPSGAPALPPPPVQPQLPPPPAVTVPVPPTAPTAPLVMPGFGAVIPPAPAAPVAPVAPAAQAPAGFGAPAATASAQTVQAPVPPAEAPKRTRRTRAQIEADEAAAKGGTAPAADPRVAHLDAAMQATIAATGGPDGAVGKALLAQYPAQQAITAAAPSAPVVAEGSSPAPTPAGPSVVTPAPAVPNAFGGAPVAPTPPPATTALAGDLAERLRQRLAAGAAFAATTPAAK